jgi:predicted kinase
LSDSLTQSINSDVYKTKEKCAKACKEALAAGKSVVIDATNPSKRHRKVYIDQAHSASKRFSFSIPFLGAAVLY